MQYFFPLIGCHIFSLQKQSKDRFGLEGDEESTMMEESVSPKKYVSQSLSLEQHNSSDKLQPSPQSYIISNTSYWITAVYREHFLFTQNYTWDSVQQRKLCHAR